MPPAYRTQTRKFAVTCDVCNVLLAVARQRKFARCSPCIRKVGFQKKEHIAALLALNPHP